MKHNRIFIAAATLGGAQAFAQSPPAPQPKDTIEEVVVTGSRIASPNATSTSPVQVVTREDMQVSGKHDITDIIAQLPQNFTNDLGRSEEHTSELQSQSNLVCRLLLEKKKKT